MTIRPAINRLLMCATYLLRRMLADDTPRRPRSEHLRHYGVPPAQPRRRRRVNGVDAA